MPIVKDGRSKKDRFRCQTQEEIDLINKAQENFCDSNHDNYDFIYNFLSACSLRPGTYIHSVKSGKLSISIESWNKIKEYVTTLESE